MNNSLVYWKETAEDENGVNCRFFVKRLETYAEAKDISSGARFVKFCNEEEYNANKDLFEVI